MRSFFALLLTSALLWTVVATVNHEISSWHVYLFAGGLYITYAALEMPLGLGMAAAFCAGLICDSNAGVRFGTHALLFSAGHACLFHLRERLPADQVAGRVAIALLANFGLFLGISFLEIDRLPDPGSAWPRIGVDLIASQLFLALIAPWYFAAQERLLVFVRARAERLA